ncbi:hypothetical protein N0824_03176 [Microcystis sp. 0824]|nr:hypothetical protein N0824_03176 [Microcystis sp. 0824]
MGDRLIESFSHRVHFGLLLYRFSVPGGRVWGVGCRVLPILR